MAISSSAFDQVAMLACTEPRCSPTPQLLCGRSFLKHGVHRALTVLLRPVMAYPVMLAPREVATGTCSRKLLG